MYIITQFVGQQCIPRIGPQNGDVLFMSYMLQISAFLAYHFHTSKE